MTIDFKALLLAGITHDIGKRAFVADHAAEGARHVPVVAQALMGLRAGHR